jgi:hypothetical protein
MPIAKKRLVRGKAVARDATAVRKPGRAPAIHGDLKRPFIAEFIDLSGNLLVDRLARSFYMSKRQLAETAGIKPDALYKARRARAPKTQNRVREMLEVLSMISEWAGGEGQAMAWYRGQPLPAFGGRTAEALVKSGQAAALRDYLDHIALGGHA